MADEEEHDHTDDGQADEPAPPPKGGRAKGINRDELKGVVRELLDELLGDDEEPDTTTEPATPATAEHRAERSVRDEIDAVLHEREHQAEHDRLKTPAPEAPPRRERKLTRMMWGGSDK